MVNRKDFNRTRAKTIDDTVVAKNDFSNGAVADLRYDSAGLGKLRDAFDGIQNIRREKGWRNKKSPSQ